jgi:hypothetical protein
MSGDFLMTLAGRRAKDARDITYSVLHVLEDMGFSLMDYFDELTFDLRDKTFEASDRFEAMTRRDGLSPRELLSWKLRQGFGDGILLGMVSPWITLDIMLGAVGTSFNCFGTISERKLISLFQAEALSNLYRLYGRIAEAMEAIGGFGGMNRDPVLLSPDAVLDAILEDPGNPGFPVSLGMLSVNALSRHDLDILAKGKFMIRQWENKYWILEENDFCEVYSALSL